MILPGKLPRRSDVADHYDELDPFYRDLWGEHVHHGLWLHGAEPAELAAFQLVRHVADRAGVGPASRVCDVGCGYGSTARILAREYGARVVGITVSRVQHEYAVRRARSAANVEFVLGDWLEHGFAAGAFEVVLAIESTEHMADKEACFAAARRVLAPGGRLVVCAWLASAEPSPWQVRHLLEPICREGRLAGLGSAAEYRRWIEQAGLVVQEFEDLTPQVWRTWSVCIGRAVSGLARRAEYRRYLLSPRSRQRVFALTLPRIWLAYRTGAMRYGMFVARKPA